LQRQSLGSINSANIFNDSKIVMSEMSMVKSSLQMRQHEISN